MYNNFIKTAKQRSSNSLKRREFSVGVRKCDGVVKYTAELLP